MKLSEMDTVRGAQVMAEIAGPIGVLVKNPATKEFVKAHGNETVGARLIFDAFTELAPTFLRDEADATFAILAALSGKTLDEVRKQPFKETCRDVKACIDGDLLGFFH